MWFGARPLWFGERGSPGRKPSTGYLGAQHRRLNRFFDWLLQRGHIEENPMQLIGRPTIEHRTVPTVSDVQLAMLTRELDPESARTGKQRFYSTRDTAILMILVDSPIRRGELGGMTLSDADLDTELIHVIGKGSKQRAMQLGATAANSVWEYIQLRSELNPTTDMLWVSSTGRPLGAKGEWLRPLLLRVCRRAGIPPIHPHQFRHTYAVTALRAGMSERFLALAGGWRKIPDTYLRTLDAEDAARIQRQISPGDQLARRATKMNRRRKGDPSTAATRGRI